MGIIKLIASDKLVHSSKSFVAALSKDTDLFTAVKRLFHGCEKIVSQL